MVATEDPPGVGIEPITVVVCTRDRTGLLSRVLGDLAVLDQAMVSEIVVVDNAPATSDTAELVSELRQGNPRLRYVLEPKPGLSAARNAGLRAATTPWVAFTDDDVRVDAAWAQALISGKTTDRVKCVSGLVAAAELETAAQQRFDRRIPWARRVEPMTFRRDNADSPLFPYDSGRFGTGANLFVNRHFALGIGGFDELLGTGTPTGGGEDLDFLCRVIVADGEIVYEPSALVWHPHPATDDALMRQLHGYGMGLGAYLAKLALSRHALRVAWRAPRAVVHLLRTTGNLHSATSEADPQSDYRSERRTELAGVIAGAVAYSRSRWRTR